jgi:hypothetical protein
MAAGGRSSRCVGYPEHSQRGKIVYDRWGPQRTGQIYFLPLDTVHYLNIRIKSVREPTQTDIRTSSDTEIDRPARDTLISPAAGGYVVGVWQLVALAPRPFNVP